MSLDDSSRTTQTTPAQERLAELQEWYSFCTSDYDDADTPWSFHEDEVVDQDQIKLDINELLPGITKDLRNGYCRPCQELPEKLRSLEFRPQKSDVHMSSIKELVAGKIVGCVSCQFIIGNLRSDIPTGHNGNDALISLHKVENRLKLLGHSTNLVLRGGVQERELPLLQIGYMNFVARGLGNVCEHLLVLCLDEPEELSSTLRFPLQPNRDSLNVVKQWLSACAQSHPRCKKNITDTLLPTRLLEIDINTPSSSDGPSEILSVRLVETSSWDNNISYATLSHCWGKPSFTKLTAETFDPYKIDIPWSLFTKTFQEAILTTCHLGLRYLWIDSFCIIQDSISDWETESSLMASVYGGSYINIAAAWAKDGSEGLMPKNTPATVGMIFPSPSPYVPDCLVVRSSLYEDGIRNTHLSSRAWCFQERLLAPRSLYFGCKDLFWECQMNSACDSFPNGIPISLLEYYHQHPKKLLANWEYIVRLYSKSNLTYQTDKLVALSAVARVAQKMSGDDYIAGMWRSTLEISLLWACDGINGTIQFSSGGVFRAPTWSWASVDGPVNYFFPFPFYARVAKVSALLSNVLDVTLSAKGPDPFGQLSDGVLTLECAGMLQLDHGPDFLPELRLDLDNTRFPNTQVPNSRDRRKFLKNYYGREENYIKLVPVLNMGDDTHGLIVKPTNRNKGEFERIGMFTDYDFEMFQRLMKSGSEMEMARKCCAETRITPETGVETYVITIV